MSERFMFPVAEIRSANARAAKLAVLDYGGIPEGLTLDPTPVLESFGCLRVTPGWKLRAYLSGGLNSESRVVALPEDYVAAADELQRRRRRNAWRRPAPAPPRPPGRASLGRRGRLFDLACAEHTPRSLGTIPGRDLRMAPSSDLSGGAAP